MTGSNKRNTTPREDTSKRTGKRAKKGKSDDEREEDDHTPPNNNNNNNNNNNKTNAAQPKQLPNCSRRPFFGVIDNISSYSGVIEGPYDFGFAISVTVDRQTFKGVVFKSTSNPFADPSFPDEEVMLNFAQTAKQQKAAKNSKSKTTDKDNHNSTNSNNLNGSINGINNGHNNTTSFDNYLKNDDEDEKLLPSVNTLASFSSRVQHDRSQHDHSPESPSSPPDSPQHQHGGYPPKSYHHEGLPAIHSVLQSIASPTSSAPSPHQPLPPQPQLQRQKQRQKKRQEKKLLELQQTQPERYKSIIERDKSKIPLLGDEGLVDMGQSILEQIASSTRK